MVEKGKQREVHDDTKASPSTMPPTCYDEHGNKEGLL